MYFRDGGEALLPIWTAPLSWARCFCPPTPANPSTFLSPSKGAHARRQIVEDFRSSLIRCTMVTYPWGDHHKVRSRLRSWSIARTVGRRSAIRRSQRPVGLDSHQYLVTGRSQGFPRTYPRCATRPVTISRRAAGLVMGGYRTTRFRAEQASEVSSSSYWRELDTSHSTDAGWPRSRPVKSGHQAAHKAESSSLIRTHFILSRRPSQRVYVGAGSRFVIASAWRRRALAEWMPAASPPMDCGRRLRRFVATIVRHWVAPHSRLRQALPMAWPSRSIAARVRCFVAALTLQDRGVLGEKLMERPTVAPPVSRQ